MKSTSPRVSETWMLSTWLSSRISSSWNSWNSYTTFTEVTGIADTMSVFCQEHGGRGRVHPHILFLRGKDEALPYQPYRQTVGYNPHHLKRNQEGQQSFSATQTTDKNIPYHNGPKTTASPNQLLH